MPQLEQELLLRSIRRAYGIPIGPVNAELSLLATVNAGDIDQPPFHAKRGGSRFLSQAAVAGEISHVQLQVPNDEAYDGLVRVVRWFMCSANAINTDDWFDWYVGPIAGLPEDPIAGAIVGIAWDQPEEDGSSRDTHPHVGAYTNPTGIITKAGAIHVPQYATGLVPGPFVLRKGAALDVCNTTVNRYCGVTFYWDDYDLST